MSTVVGDIPQQQAVSVAMLRAIEVVQRRDCEPTVPGIKVTPSGKVLRVTTSCEGMTPNGPQCVDPSVSSLVVNGVAYFQSSAGQQCAPAVHEAVVGIVRQQPLEPLPLALECHARLRRSSAWPLQSQ